MSEEINNPADGPDELTITRILAAPRALVWRMFTEIDHALQWGGPREYPMIRLEAELRPGGKWRGCLRSKDGTEELWQGGVYREIVPMERLVYTFAWDKESGNSPIETLITLTFEDAPRDQTKMTFHQTPFVSVESRDGHREGWNSAFDRLDDYLSEVAKK